MLHIFNQPLFRNTLLTKALATITPDDAILFIEDGVYSLLYDTEIAQRLLADINIEQLFVLENDMIARGISDKISPSIQRINYDGFVELCIKYQPTQNW